MVKKISRRIDLTEDNLFSKDNSSLSVYKTMLKSKKIIKKYSNFLNRKIKQINSEIDLYLEDKYCSIYWKIKEQSDNFNLKNELLYRCHFCGKKLPPLTYGLCKKCDREFGLSQNNKISFETFF